jgi:excisionase family DNA binding protein
MAELALVEAGRDLTPLLLRPNDVVTLLSVSRAEVYNMIARGDLAHVRVGGQQSGVRVVYASVLEWVERSTQRGYVAEEERA